MIVKRVFDLVLATLITLVCALPFAVLTMWMLSKRDLPLFYISERMTRGMRAFQLVKFRTMRVVSEDQNTGVTGSDKSDRITPIGAFLRSKRLDEFPQLVNVFKGEMSLVGPRPPLRRYTDRFPELYTQVLSTPAGITGLASVVCHHHEARLLAECATAEETEAVYLRRCIPVKARVDMLYVKRVSIRLDLYILYLTAAKFIPLPGRRAKRIRSNG